MHSRSRLLALALVVVALAPRPVRAQGPAGSVRIRPAAVTVGVGQSATVEVWLEGGTGYYGVELRLAADPALVAVQVAPLWGALDPAHHILVKSEAGWCDDQSGGRWYGAWYAAANVSPAPAFGSGRICAVTLTGLAPGAGTLHIALARGGTDTGGALQPASADGAFVVTFLTPTPTGTPTPTRTATPTPVRTGTAATAAALATPPAAALLPVAGGTPSPRPRLAGATETPTATCTGTPGATPMATPAPYTMPASIPSDEWRGLLTYLLPFLVGATLTGVALRLFRRR